MATLIMILGILMVIFGALCAFTPLATLTAAGFFIAAVLIVSGVMGIISGIRYRFYGLNFVVSLLALALGVIAVLRPGGIEAIDRLLIILFAIWLLVRGCTSISVSLRLKKLRISSDWIWGFIIGVLAIALGIVSFIQPVIPAMTIGILIGLFFIEEGINTIAMGRVARSMRKAVEPLKQQRRENLQ